MTQAVLFDTDPSEPLGILWSASEASKAFGNTECRRFEFNSRGDRVPARLLLPEKSTGPSPLVLLQHGAGGSKESPYLESAAPWLRQGAAVATIDFPLHGERSSAKLSERLVSGDPTEGVTRLLQIEFARQAVIDLRRALDALATVPELDAKRIAYAGFSLGGMLGAVFCANDPRPRAAALALAGGGLGPAEVDPCAFVGRIAPRPVLFVNVESDERIPRGAAEKLHASVGDPHEIQWFEGSHGELPGVALKTMWSFLREALELS